MEELKQELEEVIIKINDLEAEIEIAKQKAHSNIEPLKNELSRLKEVKRRYAFKNDPDSVRECIRREDNLKFKINAQRNEYLILTDELFKLNTQKEDLEYKIQLEKDKIKKNQLREKLDLIISNYEKSQNLKDAAIASNVNPDHAEQWLEWGKNDYDESYSYFFKEIQKIDAHQKDLEREKTRKQMDRVIEIYRKTESLKKAAKVARVNYDTVQYWYDWGRMGFGEDNVYFYKNIE